MVSGKTVIKSKRREARATVSAAFRSVDGSWRRRVGKLNDRRGDPAPGIGAVVITVGRQLVDARAAFLKRLVAVTLQHQGGGAPDIDLGYHGGKIARLRSTNV